jgi:hypothetical protein
VRTLKRLSLSGPFAACDKLTANIRSSIEIAGSAPAALPTLSVYSNGRSSRQITLKNILKMNKSELKRST